jgi:hypothetical protein
LRTEIRIFVKQQLPDFINSTGFDFGIGLIPWDQSTPSRGAKQWTPNTGAICTPNQPQHQRLLPKHRNYAGVTNQASTNQAPVQNFPNNERAANFV